jgi:glycerol uptake facilitator-like aquaporin
MIPVHVRVYDRLAAGSAGRSLLLRGQLQIDGHLYTYINNNYICRSNTISEVDSPRPPLARRLLAELLGSAFLAALVIGSGIAAQTLSPHDVGLQLLENAVATAAGLATIILMFAPISGAHFNPVVSLVDASFGALDRRDTLAYVSAQVTGCVLGAFAANAMFARAALSISTKHRASLPHLLGEAIATAGLLLVIFSLARTRRGSATPAAVGAYIGAAYFFTSSTSFANPAISVGRIFSNSFSGIAPTSVPAFIGAQLLGAACAVLVLRILYPTPSEAPHDGLRAVRMSA